MKSLQGVLSHFNFPNFDRLEVVARGRMVN